MCRILFALLLLIFAVIPVAAQDAVLSQEFSAALLELGDLEHYTVTWEIEITEWLASWDADELTGGIDRKIALTYTDYYQAGTEHFMFQRLATVTEQRFHQDQAITYTAEIRIIDGTIYVRAEVVAGEISRGYPHEWTEWRYPDQWPVFEDLLPHTYFAAVELNSSLPLFDLSPEAIIALTTQLSAVQASFWPWQDTDARQLSLYELSPDALDVIAIRPSFDRGDPFSQALLDYRGPKSEQLFRLYFDRVQTDMLIGIEDIRVIDTVKLPRSAFEDGAPDNLWLDMNNMRVSAIDFRDINADFTPVDAPVID
jgi:hypothetical protein